jgi:glucose-6-phosphate 1-dehydrogenase
VREAWIQSDGRPKSYTAGSWGPAAASSLIGKDGYAWHGET